jgi:predicted nucleic acid-binding protein
VTLNFRRGSPRLSDLLEAIRVWIHPFVVGELACGNLSRRTEVLSLLEALPRVSLVDHEEVLNFIAVHRLPRRGLGWIEVHLLACARLAGVSVWTLDKRLASAARELALAPADS